ncbi:MAG: hypothetical protein GX916_10310, partial [Clostridiales bacterium]|nr:hypothetical protein [Clostridiales bacterium]
VKTDNQVLLSQRKMILTPGEMAVTRLKADMLCMCRGAEEITLMITPEKQT